MGDRSFRRDAERSRQAILDAAERLFAELGFEAVSMERIGRAAGLSRGAPGYFFRSKDALYRAVLQRMFESTEQLVAETRQVLAAKQAVALDSALEVVVSNLLDFLYERPAFMTLVEREALRRSGPMEGTRVHLSLVRTALTLIVDELGFTAATSEAQQVLLSLLSLCWFPLAHRPLIRDLGGELDSDFIEARKRHVVTLLKAGLEVANT